MPRIAIATLGCKANAFESAVIAGGFTADDCEVVDFDMEADIYIINTCTVTNRSDFKSRNLIRKALRRKAANPSIKVVVTGCYAQRELDEVLALGDIDLVADNQQKLDIAALLSKTGYRWQDIMQAREFAFKPVSGMYEHTRAFLKVQDGCDFYCSYCAVPYARGHNRSASMEDVIAQARLFVDNGHREIVLGGINLGLYKDGSHSLETLLRELHKLQGLELIRLSSIEPQLWTPALLGAIGELSKVCPHFHIPLQSGCDSVLKRMGRHYSTAGFKALVDDLLAARNAAAIGADVISGFPGETDAEADATQAFIQSLPLAYLHVFAYSMRKGTPAAKMPGQVPKDIKHARSACLIKISEAKTDAYKRFLIERGIPLTGVVETQAQGHATFLSDHFIRGYTSEPVPVGELATILPARLYLDGVQG
jgi:threonylcarbamoyladenosine tRNA methylthiotransferase MtaB